MDKKVYNKINLVSKLLKTLCNAYCLRLIGILYSHNHLLVLRKLDSRTFLSLRGSLYLHIPSMRWETG